MSHTPPDVAVRELRHAVRDLAQASIDTAAHTAAYTAALIFGPGGGTSDLNNMPPGHLLRLRTAATRLTQLITARKASQPCP